MSSDGAVKTLDFGLAKLTEQTQACGSPSAATADVAIPVTEKGSMVGTVTYKSPEQAEGKTVDPRSDIFSFGSVLYEMVTGRRAFQGDSRIATLSAALHREPGPVSQVSGGIPQELERIIARRLKKDTARLAVPVAGGTPRPIVTLPKGIRPNVMSPDGRRFVITVSEFRSDVWLMENFDPARRE